MALDLTVDGDTVRRIAAFLIKRLLTAMLLGWLDQVAGAAAGAALAIVVAGTSV